MKTTTLATALAACLSLTAPVHAQIDVVSGGINDPENRDAMYEYDLYIALPETAKGWLLEYVYEDGYKKIHGPFKTERDARLRAERDEVYLGHLHNGELPVEEYIYFGLAEPNWEYFQTYPAIAEAEDAAAYFEDIGMLTDIRAVSTLRQTTEARGKEYLLK